MSAVQAVRLPHSNGTATPVRLQIGAGQSTLPNFTNCDLFPGPNVGYVFDAQHDRWPFPDGAVEEVYASHVLEHLQDPLHFFKETHRVLRPGGGMTLRLPYGGHKAAWWDLTHVRPWYPENFSALQPGYGDLIGNPQWAAWRAYFDVAVIHVNLADDVLQRIRPWWKRWMLGPLLTYGTNVGAELVVFATALKGPDAVARFRQRNPEGLLVVRWGTQRWRWENRPPREGEGLSDFAALAEYVMKFGRCI